MKNKMIIWKIREWNIGEWNSEKMRDGEVEIRK